MSRQLELKHRPIEAISFDVGGTLIEPWPSVGHVYAAIASRHGMRPVDADTLNRRFGLAWQARNDFDYSQTAWFDMVTETFGLPGSSLPETFFPELYRRFAEPEVWRIYDDVVPTLEELAGRGVILAITSNWDDRLRTLLTGLKLDVYFEALTISGEIGFHKPSPVIFEQALRKLGLPAGLVLHVGDSASEDVQGARNAGLQAILLNRHNAGETAPGTIRSLTELKTTIE